MGFKFIETIKLARNLPYDAGDMCIREEDRLGVRIRVMKEYQKPDPPEKLSSQAERILDALRDQPKLRAELAEWLPWGWELVASCTVSETD